MTAVSAPLARRSASAATVAVLLTAGGLWLFWLAGGSSLDAVRASGPDAPADLLVLGAAGVGAALLLWLGVGVTLAALTAIPGVIGRISAAAAERVTPVAVRRVTAAVLGATLATVATPVAHAGPSLSWQGPSATTSQTSQTGQTSRTSLAVTPPAPDPAFGVTTPAPVADAAPDPGRPAPASVPDPGFGAGLTTPRAPSPPAQRPLGPAPHTSSTRIGPATVTVVSGDSLWAIAHRHLGAHATAQQIAREWPRWYAANRAVIGLNPNLIRAGQVLTVPTSGPS
jgi:nucleoid-associated protein YgaU